MVIRGIDGGVTVFKEVRAPGPDPLALFRSVVRDFGARGAAFFSRHGAETVVAFDPFETLRAHGREVALLDAVGARTLHGNPFAIVSERLQAHRAQTVPGLPFFQGGALGYFSYDSVSTLEPTLLASEGNLSRPGTGPDAEVMLFREAIVFDHRLKRVVLCSDGAEGVEKLETLLAAPHRALTTRTGKPAPIEVSALEPMLGKERFLAGVARLKEHILAGDIFQAVLSEKMSRAFSGDPLQLFADLRGLAPAPYQFYFSTPERAVMGASPEMLLRVSGAGLESHPIAGTRRRGDDDAEEAQLTAELLASEKERAEHLMLVDLSRNDIGRVSTAGSVRVHDFMEVKKFGGVMHLVSRVTGQRLPRLTALEALAACFPAGTLSGAPKIRAMELLSALEPERRGPYGGAFIAAGFDDNLDSCISIRGLTIENGVATLQAGAGIVADSDPEFEYEEVRHKSHLTRTALAMSCLRASR